VLREGAGGKREFGCEHTAAIKLPPLKCLEMEISVGYPDVK